MKKRLNQKDIERLQKNIAELLGVRIYGGVLDKRNSDEKTASFCEAMNSLGGELLDMNSHELNKRRKSLHKHIFISNPAYYRQKDGSFNELVFAVPEENAETALLFGFPNPKK